MRAMSVRALLLVLMLDVRKFNMKLNLMESAMPKSVSMLEFRRTADDVLRKVQQGERFLLTYRGRPVARLEPIAASRPASDDPFYTIGEMADDSGGVLSNRQIDEILYGS